ncbi:MAG: prephenate dehydratase domain-containing protein [Clostridiaceae bacterium]
MDLEELRSKIDHVDDAIFELFEQRMALTKDIAKEKQHEGLGVQNKIREREILTRLSKKDPELTTYTRMLYTTLFSVSKSLQRQSLFAGTSYTKELQDAVQATPSQFPRGGIIGVQGSQGSYSQQAAYRIFPYGEVMFFKQFGDVFDAVNSGLCDFGVVPIENSSNGSVKEVFEVMRQKQFSIVRGTKLFIEHQLLVKPGVKFSEIKEIISQKQALGQCSDFLSAHPDIIAGEYMDTALAAEYVAKSDRRDIASISSKYCTDLYNLEALPMNIQNSDNNYTRFICISKEVKIFPGSNRISLMVSAPHEPGGLYNVLARFAALDLNITKVESRSISGQDFEFNFYFDFEGSVEMAEVQWLLNDLRSSSERFQFLGNYMEV